MQKSVRLLKIWKLCKEKRYMTAKALADCCGVVERTVFRDIRDLSELGVAIAYDNGYRVISESPLPQFDLTSQEKLLLAIALRSLPINIDESFSGLINGLLNKLLDEPAAKETVIVDRTNRDQFVGNTFFRLQRAIEKRRLVTLQRYRKLNDDLIKGRVIEPYLLVHRERHWYLIAWASTDDKFKIYRLDRIEKMSVEEQTYNPRQFDPEAYFRGSFGVVIDGRQRLRVRFAGLAKEIVSKGGRFPPEDLHDYGNALILNTSITGEIQWLRWILGFGGEAEILEPESMRQEANTMLREALQNYSSCS